MHSLDLKRYFVESCTLSEKSKSKDASSMSLKHELSISDKIYNSLASIFRSRRHQEISYSETRVDEIGFLISRKFFAPVLIPWKEIEVLSLGGLNAIDLSWIKVKIIGAKYFPFRKPSRTRSLLIMSGNHELLQLASNWSRPKTWLTGKNVLGIMELSVQSAEWHGSSIKDLAISNSVKLDVIVLDP